jgi:hypothetical protein
MTPLTLCNQVYADTLLLNYNNVWGNIEFWNYEFENSDFRMRLLQSPGSFAMTGEGGFAGYLEFHHDQDMFNLINILLELKIKTQL